jgi:glycerate 2-kinase
MTGAAAVLDAVGFRRRLSSADAVVSGEGRLDPTSLQGKLVGEIAARCNAASKPLHLLVGELALDDAALRELGAQTAREAPTPEALEAAAASLPGSRPA